MLVESLISAMMSVTETVCVTQRIQIFKHVQPVIYLDIDQMVNHGVRSIIYLSFTESGYKWRIDD